MYPFAVLTQPRGSNELIEAIMTEEEKDSFYDITTSMQSQFEQISTHFDRFMNTSYDQLQDLNGLIEDIKEPIVKQNAHIEVEVFPKMHRLQFLTALNKFIANSLDTKLKYYYDDFENLDITVQFFIEGKKKESK